MRRRKFIGFLAAGTGMLTLGGFKKLTEELTEEEQVMPVAFIGHGSPMNAIENNLFTEQWKTFGSSIPKPQAVLCISAHWLSKGTKVTAMEKPRTIHDFGGFPQELFNVQYPAPGNPELATETINLLGSGVAVPDHDWGLDHGTWSVVKNMYPDANIPVLQMSIDFSKDMKYHYDLAAHLADLRKKGVLIIGSGNLVHNLGMVDWQRLNDHDYGYDWCIEMNTKFKELIEKGDHQAMIDYQKLGASAQLAIPTTDHYIPALSILGLKSSTDQVSFFNDHAVAGSLTMTSFVFNHHTQKPVLPGEGNQDSLSTDTSAIKG